MLEILFILATAMLLGMRHATEPDHVLAVSTIVARERTMKRAWGIGAVWGAGHTLTILAGGGALLLFRVAIPPRLSVAFELCVALMLIVLGARNLLPRWTGAATRASVQPFVIGLVHGLAGSAAASLMIVPLIRDPLWAVLSLVVFGVGTMAGMALLTSVIARSAMYATHRFTGLDRWIRVGAGGMSLSFGALLIYRIA